MLHRPQEQTSAGRGYLMRGLLYSLCYLCFLAIGGGGPSSESVLQSVAASSGWEDVQARKPDSQGSSDVPKGQIDACALITNAEIEAVQGEPVRETKSSESPSSSFVMSQCFFRTATFAKSISLALATPDPAKPSGLTPREYWQKQFHPPDQAEKEKDEPAAGQAKAPKETQEEREKELRKPRVIDGLGEEAYWTGSPITGALYVLKGDAFLRISVGGEKDESVRIKKAKTLAEKEIGRASCRERV